MKWWGADIQSIVAGVLKIEEDDSLSSIQIAEGSLGSIHWASTPAPKKIFSQPFTTQLA